MSRSRVIVLLRRGALVVLILAATASAFTSLAASRASGHGDSEARRTAAFCQAAQLFTVRALDSRISPSAARNTLEHMAALSSGRLRADLMVLATSGHGPASSAEQAAGQRVAEYAQHKCGINFSR